MKEFTAVITLILLFLSLPAQAQDKVTLGKTYMTQGQYAEAAAMFKMVVDVNPRNAEALMGLSKAYLKMGKLDSAEIAAKNLLLFDDKNVQAYQLLTETQVAAKRYAEAYATLRRGTKQTKKNPALLLPLGWLHLANDSTAQAEVAFSQAKQAFPKSAEAYRGLGDAYLKMGAEPVALMQYEESIKRDSVQVDLRFKMANLYLQDRRYNEAAKMYISVLRHEPDNDQAALEVGKIYMLAKQYANATHYLSKYVTRHGDDQKTWSMYMEALDKSRQYESALEAANHLLAADPNDPLALRLSAKAHFMMRQYDQSIDYYTKLTAVDTLSAEESKRFGKAYYYYTQRNDSLAIFYMEQSYAKDSTQADLYNEMGSSYMRLKQWEKAAMMFQKKFQSDSTFAAAYVNYALCNMANRNFEPARVALYKAIELRPTYIYGHLYLARTLASMDSSRAARTSYETAATLADSVKDQYKTELGEAYRYISIAHLSEKANQPALAAVTKALEFRPQDMELQLWRAQILHALDRRDEAKTQYEKVLRLDPKNADAQKGLDILQLYN